MLLQSIQRAACQLQTLRCLSYGLTSGVPVCSALQPTPAHQQQQQQLHHWQGRQQPEQELEQQRSLLGTVSQQLSPIILPLAARKFTSSSSCGEEQHAAAEQASSQQPDSLQQAQESTEQQLKATFAAMPHSAVQRFVNQPAFWNNLSSNIKGRKPAIKRPARHQWRYCAPDYDPMEPFEARPLPPYASWRAQLKDYNKIYHETKPQFWRNRYQRLWRKNMAIADQRWRQAWEQKLAAARDYDKKVQKLSQRIIRERSWQMWQLQKQSTQQLS